MMLQYGITMIVCLAFAYAGMFGYFKLFDDEQSGTDVVAIATAPPRVVVSTQCARDVRDIVCVPTIHIDNNMEAIPQQTQTCFSSMSKPP
ncbi:MAG: hypothetical protein K2N12_06255 [Helicobacter sp.]|nr:hypothetical protein [Helicobacter sp.]